MVSRAGWWTAVMAGTAAAVLAACGPDSGEARTEVVVYAASSLTEAFLGLEAAFEARHPGVDVRPTFAGSQVLRLQLEQGAAADVFASADERHVNALFRAGLIEQPRTFAWNDLVVVVPEANPAGIDRFEALDGASRLVVGSAGVPIGLYTRRLIDRAEAELGAAWGRAVRAAIVSEESNVRLVRAKVQLGEADAAIIYRTDARHVPGLRVIDVPDRLSVRAHYPIAVVTRTTAANESALFVDFVVSPEGREILGHHGFAAHVP